MRRNTFLDEFNPIFIEAYNIVSDQKEKVAIYYEVDAINEPITDKEQIIASLTTRYHNIKGAEIKRATTLFGPQKDDLRITINDGIAREFASQGQHKTLLIALKFAEFHYLLEKKKETPIILFDDIFSELDTNRIDRVLGLLSKSDAQIIITLTDPKIISNTNQIPNKMIEIKERNRTNENS